MAEQETGAWRGVIEDGRLVEEHDPSYDEEREYSDIEDFIQADEPDDQEPAGQEPVAKSGEDEDEEPAAQSDQDEDNEPAAQSEDVGTSGEKQPDRRSKSKPAPGRRTQRGAADRRGKPERPGSGGRRRRSPTTD